jgi:hypothetical protein
LLFLTSEKPLTLVQTIPVLEIRTQAPFNLVLLC